ncbi:UDP-N-acetylmuramate--L-alanine ligase [Candidatus Bipolaricaulota bacterium]|nr:UDP-N-acetylmuramate--L-alanine ligase [Candidatus Bipolaricaulota bacterium]
MRELPGQVHLIGVGGEGMVALAQLLLEAGFELSGTDIRPSPRLTMLGAKGGYVQVGHHQDHLPDRTKLVIHSSAIPPDNPELVAAQMRGLPVLPRLGALKALLRGRRVVAIAGTHGKTTTTTWVAHMVHRLTGQGGHYIGAEVPGFPSARLGRGPFVLEVDESDGLFTHLPADIAVITNVDCDHLNTYGDFRSLHRAFLRFARQAGKVALCLDDPGAASLVPQRPDALTYGLGGQALLRAQGITFQRSSSTFDVWLGKKRIETVSLPAPGAHNVCNALAALAAGILLGLPPRELCRALSGVPRPRRRLEVLEENGYLVVDDYAHHPRELACGLAALRGGWPDRRIVAIFQPHRFSRTARLARAFGQVLARAEQAVVTEIYPACEPPLPGVSGAWVAEAARAAKGKVSFSPSLPEAMENAASVIRPGDVVACFGAGDIWKLAREMARGLSSGA